MRAIKNNALLSNMFMQHKIAIFFVSLENKSFYFNSLKVFSIFVFLLERICAFLKLDHQNLLFLFQKSKKNKAELF